jgi:hypothetical protein
VRSVEDALQRWRRSFMHALQRRRRRFRPKIQYRLGGSENLVAWKSRTARLCAMRAAQCLSVLALCVRRFVGASLFAPAEKGNQCVSQIFSSLQIFGHPNIPLGKSSVHEVRDIELARAAQFGVLPCFCPVMLCPIRPAFHFSPPHLPQAYISWEVRRPDGCV